MASTKILDGKKAIVSEIEKSIADSESVILFQYQGLTVAELSELRRNLKGTDATVKVYKNTLLKRALDDMNYSFDGFLEGPNAILFGKFLLVSSNNCNIFFTIIHPFKFDIDTILLK